MCDPPRDLPVCIGTFRAFDLRIPQKNEYKSAVNTVDLQMLGGL